MNKTILTLVLGLLVGTGATALVVKLNTPPPPPPGPSPEEVTELKQNLKSAQTKIEQMDKVNSDLIASIAKLKREYAAAAPAPAPAPQPQEERKPGGFLASLLGGGSDTNRAKAMRGLMEAGMKHYTESKVASLKLRLKLTPEQEQRVRDLLNRQSSQGMEMASKMFEGKLSKEELAKLGESKINLNDELKNILSPEQMAQYEQYQTQKRQNRAQTMANMELSQMQETLQLDEGQQQKVFDVLYQQSQQHAGEWEDGTAPNPSNWQQTWEQREQAKTDALRTVLTPEQFETYQKQQETQKQMIKTVTESFISGGATGSVQVITTPTITVDP